MLRFDLDTGKAQKTVDRIAEEIPLQISINSVYSLTIWCSPMQFKELAVGYLLAEGILKSVDEIKEITVDEQKFKCQVSLEPIIDLEKRMNQLPLSKRFVPLIKASTSPYQRNEKIVKVQSDLRVKAQVIFDCIKDLNTRARGFKETGGLHDSAIYMTDGSIVAFSEDVGRHNTVDKVIGMAALKRAEFSKCFMIITGRVPGDMIYKAAKVGVPIVASVAAVLSSGVYSAEKANITLVGFVRGRRMNIYTCPERIVF
jgi:formate dehydrogenase accessory protein FdhD